MKVDRDFDDSVNYFVQQHFHSLPVKLHIEKMIVEGLSRTDEKVVRREFEAATKDAESFQDVLGGAELAARHLMSTDLFESVSPLLDEGSEPDQTRVRIRVKEKNALSATLGVHTNMYVDQASLSGKVTLRNPLGGTERVEASTTATRTTRTFDVSFINPRINATDTCFTARGFRFINNKRAASLHEEHVTGATVNLTFNRFELQHSVTYELAWRALDLMNGCSNSLREEKLQEAGSLKGSLIYTLVKDGRDHVQFPTKGYVVRNRAELAGVGGNVHFFKNEISGGLYIPVLPRVTLTSSLGLGLLLPMFGDRTRVCDRFFLGGLNTVRGFTQNKLGVRDGTTHLGGDVSARASVALQWLLPATLLRIPIRAHVFVDAGNLVARASDDSVGSTVKELVTHMRSTVGVGLLLDGPLRFEANLCHPIRSYSDSDTTSRFSFGVRVDV